MKLSVAVAYNSLLGDIFMQLSCNSKMDISSQSLCIKREFARILTGLGILELVSKGEYSMMNPFTVTFLISTPGQPI
jgi:hypothetical protein